MTLAVERAGRRSPAGQLFVVCHEQFNDSSRSRPRPSPSALRPGAAEHAQGVEEPSAGALGAIDATGPARKPIRWEVTVAAERRVFNGFTPPRVAARPIS